MRGRQFSRWVVDLRRNLGLSQTQLADVVNVCVSLDSNGSLGSACTVSCWENGHHEPRPKTLELMAAIDNERRRREREGKLGWSYHAILKFAHNHSRPKKEPQRAIRSLLAQIVDGPRETDDGYWLHR